MDVDPHPAPRESHEDPDLLQLALEAQQPYLDRAWVAALCHAAFLVIGAVMANTWLLVVYTIGVVLAGRRIRAGSALAAGGLLVFMLFAAFSRLVRTESMLGFADLLVFSPFYLLAVRAAHHAAGLRRTIDHHFRRTNRSTTDSKDRVLRRVL